MPRQTKGEVKKFAGNMVGYEKKLDSIMRRLGIEDDQFDYSHGRFEAWVTFHYKGGFYRFEYSIDRAQERGFNIERGTDVFAMLVLGLEDLARLVERGLYDLQTWISGLKALPPAHSVPNWCLVFGFTEFVPASMEQVDTAYRRLAQSLHPDKGGSETAMANLNGAREEARGYFDGRR